LGDNLQIQKWKMSDPYSWFLLFYLFQFLSFSNFLCNWRFLFIFISIANSFGKDEDDLVSEFLFIFVHLSDLFVVLVKSGAMLQELALDLQDFN
jgi:hypothetical protein